MTTEPMATEQKKGVEQPGTPDGRPLSEQPKWRRDFPVDWQQDEYVSRRDLVKFVCLTSLAFVTGQFWLVGRKLLSSDAAPPMGVPIAKVDDIPIGGSRVFYYPKENPAPRILVRTEAWTFVAFEQQCTHLMCPVVPQVEKGRLHCPCHNGNFDLATGRPISGPPTRPLARVTVQVVGDTVYATDIEERTL